MIAQQHVQLNNVFQSQNDGFLIYSIDQAVTDEDTT